MSDTDKMIDNLKDEHIAIKEELVELGLENISVSKDGMETDIPSIGVINVLKIDEPNRECSFVVTDLEPSQAFEFFQGRVETIYGEALGRVCPVTLKFIDYWKNYDKRGSKAEVFSLLSCPYLVRRNVSVDKAGVNLTKNDVQIGYKAYDSSVATKAIDAYILEHEMRIDAEEKYANVRANVHYWGTKTGADVIDDADLGIQEFSRQTEGRAFGTFTELWSWIKKNKLVAGIGIIVILYFLGTYLGVI